jgi:hypothetical protein
MKYILLILILFLVILHLRATLSLENFAECRRIQKTICHYLSKDNLPDPKYYMNRDNFMKNILPLMNTENNRIYVKSHHIHDSRKNLNYYFSKYNQLNNDNNPEVSKNKHIELVFKTIKSSSLETRIKIKMILTLFDLNNLDQSSNHYIFVPYILNEDNRPVNILTKNFTSIKLIGLYNLDNKRVDYTVLNSKFTEDGYDYNDIDQEELFTEDEINEICKDELSILCKNNFESINNSLTFYKENHIPTTTSTQEIETCDIFSSQTKYLDNSKNTFF